MKFFIDLDYSNVSQQSLSGAFQELNPEIIRIKEASTQKDYNSNYASVALIQDKKSIQVIDELVIKKKALNPSLLIVIGIGGSNLGTLAIQEALLGKLYNDKEPSIKVYYADTVDSDYCNELLSLARTVLQVGKIILINVVTKSGTTTETIVNFELFLALLMEYRPHDYQEHIIITTDQGSKLSHLAQQQNLSLLEIPKKVGGRYSVFSAVGLFPLGILGCDTKSLLQGAASILESCSSLTMQENYAAQTALIKYEQYNNGLNIQDMFLFSVQLEGIGRWYRQLMGESIGKEFDVLGNKVDVGITPTVSMGTVDLHSVGQLYLGGPRDKGTTFISLENYTHDLLVPHFDSFEQLVPRIQGKPVAQIMNAILMGVKKAYVLNKRPFVSITLPECSAYYIGQFLQYSMIEMIYLGYLLKVNPFDQPNVESYKEETRKILAQ